VGFSLFVGIFRWTSVNIGKGSVRVQVEGVVEHRTRVEGKKKAAD